MATGWSRPAISPDWRARSGPWRERPRWRRSDHWNAAWRVSASRISKADGVRLGALGSHPMADRLLGVLGPERRARFLKSPDWFGAPEHPQLGDGWSAAALPASAAR